MACNIAILEAMYKLYIDNSNQSIHEIFIHWDLTKDIIFIFKANDLVTALYIP